MAIIKSRADTTKRTAHITVFFPPIRHHLSNSFSLSFLSTSYRLCNFAVGTFKPGVVLRSAFGETIDYRLNERGLLTSTALLSPLVDNRLNLGAGATEKKIYIAWKIKRCKTINVASDATITNDNFFVVDGIGCDINVPYRSADDCTNSDMHIFRKHLEFTR